MGAWLGDGHTDSAGFTSADDDVIGFIRAAGWAVERCPNQGQYAWMIGTVRRAMRSNRRAGSVNDFAATLRILGVLGNKHVPPAYLRASQAQRLALLQGLMDTDGTVAKASGSAEFTSSNRRLAEAVVELACALGHKANLRESVAKLKGRITGPKWTVKWMAPEIVFRLARKAALQRLGIRRTCLFRYIVKCERVESVPVQCIKVAAADGLFLVGRTMIPTHNTWALLAEPLRHVGNPGFGAVVFRRSYPEITAVGGPWEESERLYPQVGGIPNLSNLYWDFPSGAQIKFAHLGRPQELYRWMGSQLALILWDQLEHFSEREFFYMLSRNRTTCGIRPYIRASCNPDANSWLAEFVSWWIGEDGYPLAHRTGKIRWFIRKEEKILWTNSPSDFGADGGRAKSVTFIPAKISDNKILCAKNPEYIANLEALPYLDRMRGLHGNWKVSAEFGEWPPSYFPDSMWFETWPSEWFVKVLALDPSKGKRDRVSDPQKGRQGDYSAFVWLMVDKNATLWIDADLDNQRPVEPSPAHPGQRSIVGDGLEILRWWKPHAFLVETNGFQELVADAFGRVARERKIHLPLYTINSKDNKQARIRTLGPYLAQGRIRVRNSRGGKMLVQQLKDFPAPWAKDDGADALKLAEMLADYLLNGGAAEKGIEVLRV